MHSTGVQYSLKRDPFAFILLTRLDFKSYAIVIV